MMEPEARIAALKVAVKVAYDAVGEAFEEIGVLGDKLERYEVMAYGHVLDALIRDIDDEEARR